MRTVMDSGQTTTMGSDLPSLVAKPFHFLVQEQAKCMVAIKELQDQVQSLCHFRKAVTKALPEAIGVANSMQYRAGQGDAPWPKTHASSAGRVLPTIRDGSPSVVSSRKMSASLHHSSSSTESVELVGIGSKGKNKPRNASAQKFVVVAQGKNWLRIRPYNSADSEVDDSDEPMSTYDSLCSDSLKDSRKKNGTARQDSGFSTEPQGDKSLAQSSWLPPQDKDELLSLLDVIETHSVELQSELERLHVQNPAQEDACALDCLRRERDQLADRLIQSEERSLTAHVRATQLEDRLRTACTEREQLDMRIHGMHTQFVRSGVTTRKDSSLDGNGSVSDGGGSASLPDTLLRGKVHVKPNTARLSMVLRETRVLELQRQLLSAVMENEVLKTQLEHVSKDWCRRTRDWQREVEFAQHEARTAKAALDRARLDLHSERARLRMLQRALQNAPAMDAAPSLNTHLVQSLQALGQSVGDHYKHKATNTDNELWKFRTSRINVAHNESSNHVGDETSPLSSPASLFSPSSSNSPPSVCCEEKWQSTPNLIDFGEEKKGGKNGVTHSTDPAIQQRIQNFLQRISEHLSPMETLPDDKDYLETVL